MEITQAQLNRLKDGFIKMAGENGQVELISGTFYFFGSELATLRLLKKYRSSKSADCGYSENLGKFYFSLETIG